MPLFKEKDKRYNNQLDNYTNKYQDNFKLVLVYIAIGLIGYGIYKLYNYFFL